MASQRRQQPMRHIYRRLVALGLATWAEARILNQSCAAPEMPALRGAALPIAAPRHIPSRLPPPTDEEAACTNLKRQAIEGQTACALIVDQITRDTSGSLACGALSQWTYCPHLPGTGLGFDCVPRGGGCWNLIEGCYSLRDPCAHVVPMGQFRSVGGVCVRQLSFKGTCDGLAKEGCLHLSPRGTWVSCDGHCAPRGAC